MKRLLYTSVFFLVTGVSIVNALHSALSVIQQPVFKKDTLFITRFGAVADGITLNTKSINGAIDAGNIKGGGVVVVPSGLWLTGPVVLKSNVNLHLQRGAVLQFTSDFDLF